MKVKRLSKEEWEEIKELLKDPYRNISEIARDYDVDRKAIYEMAWRRGWIKKKEKIGLWDRIKAIFKPF